MTKVFGSTAEKITREVVVNRISEALGIPEVPVGAGSTLPTEYLRSVASSLGIEAGSQTPVREVLESILNKFSISLEESDMSAGSTITQSGYRKVLRAVATADLRLTRSEWKCIDSDHVMVHGVGVVGTLGQLVGTAETDQVGRDVTPQAAQDDVAGDFLVRTAAAQRIGAGQVDQGHLTARGRDEGAFLAFDRDARRVHIDDEL